MIFNVCKVGITKIKELRKSRHSKFNMESIGLKKYAVYIY